MTTEMPENIYAWNEEAGQQWTQFNVFPNKSTKYARSDLVAAKLAAAEKMAGVLEGIGPLELVSGDTIKRLQPHSPLNLNTNATWAVTGANRSAHKLRTAVINFNEALAEWQKAGK